jgi:hypothetical protein
MLRIKSPRDVGAAATFILIGVAGLWFGRQYDLGTASQMGPGYMPMLLSIGLILFGMVVGLRALAMQGPAFERIRWRSALLILAAILAFALLIETAGLLVATFAVVILAACASGETSWKETIGLAFCLAIFCVVVFVFALKQPIPVLWGG